MKKKSLFSTNEKFSKGRQYDEKEDINRSLYQRDRDRIIHCSAFRRLEHKTQVFVHHEGDHYRSRLTHSLEVSQIARTISRRLGLDEDLSEAIALAHDLGHTPFGHAGEDALNTSMLKFGGFEHNAQTLRIITHLEKKYLLFDGLNLTWETLEGIVKHNGPMNNKKVPATITSFIENGMDLEINTYCGPEAQVASLADDIAYCNHDIDDGIRANLFSFGEIIRDVPLVDSANESKVNSNLMNHDRRIVNEAVRRLISSMIEDVINESKKRVKELCPNSAEEVRKLKKPIISFSENMIKEISALRLFLTERMYKHTSVNIMTSKARRIINDLFNILITDPNCLPINWRNLLDKNENKDVKARIVADYIAGMTDRFAINEHKKLFDLDNSWLI